MSSIDAAQDPILFAHLDETFPRPSRCGHGRDCVEQCDLDSSLAVGVASDLADLAFESSDEVVLGQRYGRCVVNRLDRGGLTEVLYGLVACSVDVFASEDHIARFVFEVAEDDVDPRRGVLNEGDGFQRSVDERGHSLARLAVKVQSFVSDELVRSGFLGGLIRMKGSANALGIRSIGACGE